MSRTALGSIMKSSTSFAFGKHLVFAFVFSGLAFAQAAAPSRPATEGAAVATQEAPQRTARADERYIIGHDDVLAISVWKEPDLSKQITVRSDGMVSLPLIGDIQAAGRTPSALEVDITNRLKGYITDPQVAVIVQEIKSLKFNILGQVIKPGEYPLTSGTTIVDAIATAGGLKDFAKKKDIYILRQSASGAQDHIPFNYQDFIKGKNTKQNIELRSRDTIVVP